MNEDLVYGILSDEDILTDANGHEQRESVHSALKALKER